LNGVYHYSDANETHIEKAVKNAYIRAGINSDVVQESLTHKHNEGIAKPKNCMVH